MKKSRYVFFISDRTGITSEGLGEALLSRFDYVEFKKRTYPFVDSVEKAKAVVATVTQLVECGNERPLIFSSIVSTAIRKEIDRCPGMHIDFFATFIHLIEKELQINASEAVGKTHGLNDTDKYDKRMEALNFTLSHDDGVVYKNLAEAEVILIGVSRTGKTPTCLYLALHYGIKAANYPMVDTDLSTLRLPHVLLPYKDKLFGLTIDPKRLHGIRTERRPASHYAALDNCVKEVSLAEKIFEYNEIPYISSTRKSVEELAACVLSETGLKRHF
ncbi:MAG: pyruvate, water dikinase regulatory protein [Neisseriaceae bacterium]